MDKKAFKLWCQMVGLDVKPHQVSGFQWCMNQEKADENKGGIICDEMGLGKTILMLGCIITNPKKRTLIVVPPALLSQWKGCIQKYLQHTPFVYHGASAKNVTSEELKREQIVLTTYGMVSMRKRPMNYQSLLWKIVWDRLICDEAHNIRNVKTNAFTGVRVHLTAEIRWMVTGTPIQNKKSDLLVLFCHIGMRIRGEKQLHDAIKRKILRRTKMGVGIEMPELTCETITVEWESKAEKNLAASIHDALPVFGVNISIENVNEMMDYMQYESPLPLFDRARQVCIYPPILEKMLSKMKEDNIVPQDFTIQKIPTASKMNAVIEKILTQPRNERKILFCHYRAEIDEFARRLGERNYRVGIYDGRTSKAKRNILCQNDENAPDILIAQIKSASEGLNLQHFSQVYFTSPHWNPSVEDQAVARAHRIGQEKEVRVFRFVMAPFGDGERSIDNFCADIQKTKRDLMKMIEQ